MIFYWLFGVLHSKMHMVWVDAVGGKLKTIEPHKLEALIIED